MPAVAVFPAMTNGAYSGYITAATIKNLSSAAATIRMVYFNQNGAPVGIGDALHGLPVNASWTVRQAHWHVVPDPGGSPRAGRFCVLLQRPADRVLRQRVRSWQCR